MQDSQSEATTDTGTSDPTTTIPVDELFINELMADNETSWSPDQINHPDWIELYNPGSTALDLLHWSLADETETLVAFSQSLTVPPGGYLVLIADSLPDSGPEHLPFKLDRGGDEIAFYAPDGRRVQWVSFDDQLPDIAAARTTDGSKDWVYLPGGTPGASNGR